MSALTTATGEYLDNLGALYAAPAREPGEPDDAYRVRVLEWLLLWDDRERVAAALRLVQRVARLNPEAGTIGAGMLAQLVADARSIVGAP